METSDIIQPEEKINISTNPNINETNHPPESINGKQEELINITPDQNLSKIIPLIEEVDTNKEQVNERNKAELSPSGSQNEWNTALMSLNMQQKSPAVVKTEPIEAEVNSCNMKIDEPVDEEVNSVNIKTEPTEEEDNSFKIKTEPLDNDIGVNAKPEGKLSNTPSVKLVAEYDSQNDTDDDDESMDTNSTAGKEEEAEVIKEVEKVDVSVIDVNGETSDSSSDSESSSTSLSSSSGEECEEEEQSQSKKSDVKKGQKKGPKETTAMPEELPTVVYSELVLPKDVILTDLGYVNSIIGQLVVIQSHQGIPALNIESVLFKESRQAIGAVYDVFGPVISPLYSIVFNNATDITTQDITLKMPVFFAPNIKDVTAYVFTDKLRHERGSDASWKNDEEPPVECLDYSDDEQEKEAKHKKQDGKEGRRRKKPQRRSDQDPGAGGERHHHQSRGRRRQWSRNGPPHNDIQNPNRPPFEGNNEQFGDNLFHNQGPPPFGQMGNQFPPRLPPQGHQFPPPPHPLPPTQGLIFPPRPPGFMGDGPPVRPFQNGPHNMGFGNQGPSPLTSNCAPPGQYKLEPPFGPQGPPFPNMNFGPGPMNSMQDSSGGMFGNSNGMWPPPPPLPPNGQFGPPMSQIPPGQNMPHPFGGPPPGFPRLPPPPPPPPSEGM